MNRASRHVVAIAILLSSHHCLRAAEFEPNHAFVPSWSSNRVIEFDEHWNEVRDLGDGTGLSSPGAVAFGPDGLLYVASFSNSKIIKLDADGVKVDELSPVGLDKAGAMAFGPSGHLFVSSSWGDEVLELDPDGNVLRVIGSGVLQFPRGIAFGVHGNMYVCSIGTDRVVEFDPSGAVLREHVVVDPEHVATGDDGDFYVTSWSSGSTYRFGSDGALKGSLADGSGQVNVSGVMTGPDGRVYVTRFSTQSIVPFDGGVAGSEISNPQFSGPGQLAFSPRRFKAKLKGEGVAAGEGVWKVSETVTISVSPGSHTLMIGLIDKASDGDLASRFAATAFLFRGFETGADSGAKARLLHGHELIGDAGQLGAGSLSLMVKGKLDDGSFLPKKATGSLMRTAGGVSFHGELKGVKPIH